ncbi:MAG: 16S rRNA (guanine(527)-N(7))-methyltransferase RsmG [Deltaproteobacteria bacterium]|nr:16S rRNA (guanine(527)-N(7))-methyltransferase RsmG [Deltaproteobacteria bacterium]
MNEKISKEIFADKIVEYFENFGIMSAVGDIDRDKIEKFHVLYTELIQWNKKINITAVTGENEFIKKHILDSAFLFKILDKEDKTIVDIGSGAGFPGIVLNIMNPALNIVSIESIYKKCNFQKNISRKLNLRNFNCINMNIFSFNFDDSLDAITTRAAFNPSELINLIEKLGFKKNINLYLFLSNLEEAEKIGHFKYETKLMQLDKILFYKTEYSFRLIAKYTVAPK